MFDNVRFACRQLRIVGTLQQRARMRAELPRNEYSMNRTIALVAGALMGLAAYGAPLFAADVGVSISVGEPGFYGRIDIGDYPRPRVYYSEPTYIERGARYREPVYLLVRPGHARNWKKYCREYGACGERVHFVNHDWYRNVYVPHYRERGGRRDGGYQNRQGGSDGRRDDGHQNRQGGPDGRRDSGQQDHGDGRDGRPSGGHDNRQGERDHHEDGLRGNR